MIDFEKELERLKVNKSGAVVSRHKPLLLLLTISKLMYGHRNEFIYDQIADELTALIRKYGLKATTKYNPQYPFIYLASNALLWHCTRNKSQLKTPDAATRSELLGQKGRFPSAFYDYLMTPPNSRHCIQLLLNQFWQDTYHEPILKDLGLGKE